MLPLLLFRHRQHQRWGLASSDQRWFRTFIDLKAPDVKQLYVPFYEGLNIQTFINKGVQWPGLKDYLPDGPDLDRISRAWLINVINTIVGTDFSDWVQRLVDSRNDKITEKQSLSLEMDPEMAQAFHESKQVSSK